MFEVLGIVTLRHYLTSDNVFSLKSTCVVLRDYTIVKRRVWPSGRCGIVQFPFYLPACETQTIFRLNSHSDCLPRFYAINENNIRSFQKCFCVAGKFPVNRYIFRNIIGYHWMLVFVNKFIPFSYLKFKIVEAKRDSHLPPTMNLIQATAYLVPT